jgi:hypothetical protein
MLPPRQILLRLLPLLLLTPLLGCQSSAVEDAAGPTASHPSTGGCDAACREDLMHQYDEAATDCRAGNQGACARKARLSAKMSSL